MEVRQGRNRDLIINLEQSDIDMLKSGEEISSRGSFVGPRGVSYVRHSTLEDPSGAYMVADNLYVVLEPDQYNHSFDHDKIIIGVGTPERLERYFGESGRIIIQLAELSDDA